MVPGSSERLSTARQGYAVSFCARLRFEDPSETCSPAIGNAQDQDGVDPIFLNGLARIEEDLAGGQSDCSVCLICLEDLRLDEAVWDCHNGCYCLFHLVCIQVTTSHPP